MDEKPILVSGKLEKLYESEPKPKSRFQKLFDRMHAPTKAGIVEQIRRATTLSELHSLLTQTKSMNLSAKTQKRVLAVSKFMLERFTEETKT